jgi:hypothetical protein
MVSGHFIPAHVLAHGRTNTWIEVQDGLTTLMVVDELEEDGSGMYYSDESSVGSSHTAG